jgi:rubrerythrin
MKISVKEADLKVNFGNGRAVLEFKLVDSILKTHFKELMRLARCYDSKEKTGYITDKDERIFKALVEKIEKSNSKRAKASHEKMAAKAKQRYSKSKCTHDDLGSLGYRHGTTVKCPHCGQMAEVW